MSELTRLPVRMLSDLVSPRALERILLDAAQARGKRLDTLDTPTLEDILKKEVFKRLQLSVPAPIAKKRVTEVLNELLKTTQERPAASANHAAALEALDEGARRFSLYFDWPEAQRLRGLIGVLRDEEQAGRDVSALVEEGQELIGIMERRLAEQLVAQGQDLAELRAAYTRVEGMGSRDVRRLETLIEQITEAQESGTLLPGEVARARELTFRLRKLLESSVIEALPGANRALDVEAQARVLALEQEHTSQLMGSLEREFGELLRGQVSLETKRQFLWAQHQAGSLTQEAVEAWRAELTDARARLLEEQRAELAALETQLGDLNADADARVVLDAARLSLGGGTLIGEQLRELKLTTQLLAAGGETREQQRALQRELAELERSARDVPGALEELAPLIADAQDGMAAGRAVNMSALWTILEGHLAAAAEQRQDFDARADHVTREYDAVRDLAGETIQRLGRLADTLRAQRRLGVLSAEARNRYEATLLDAEALLTEAQAEHRAAQEVTASFGADALSDLLDVFDVGERDSSGLGGSPAVESWRVQGGQLLEGTDEEAVQRVLDVLYAAEQAGLQALELTDSTHVWAARRDGQGGWRLARAADRVTLEFMAQRWLESGEA